MILCCIAALTAAVLASCSGDTASGQDASTVEMVVNFKVTIPIQPVTRTATPPTPTPDNEDYWGDNYLSEIGDALDYILMKDEFKVFITDGSNNVQVAQPNLFYTETSITDTYITHNFFCVIPPDKQATIQSLTNGKIHIIANAGSDAALSETQSFTKAGLAGINAIPMWGVQSVDFTKLKADESYYIGEVALLRAMAKVEIEIDNDYTDNIITGLVSVIATNVNRQGYVMPKDFDVKDKTTDIKFDDTMHAYTSVGSVEEKGDNNKITLYLPETPNNDGAATLILTYKLEGEPYQTHTSEIRFADYVDGNVTAKYNNIVRNHMYKFAVRRTAAPIQDLKIEYTVCPWVDKSVTIPDFD